MFTSVDDCIAQTTTACALLQNAFTYIAANTSIDLTTAHERVYKGALSAEQALSLPVGTLSNPNDGDPKVGVS